MAARIGKTRGASALPKAPLKGVLPSSCFEIDACGQF